jgi:hypothetical protein
VHAIVGTRSALPDNARALSGLAATTSHAADAGCISVPALSEDAGESHAADAGSISAQAESRDAGVPEATDAFAFEGHGLDPVILAGDGNSHPHKSRAL